MKRQANVPANPSANAVPMLGLVAVLGLALMATPVVAGQTSDQEQRPLHSVEIPTQGAQALASITRELTRELRSGQRQRAALSLRALRPHGPDNGWTATAVLDATR